MQNWDFKYLIILLLFAVQQLVAQSDSTFQVFKDDNGNILSEGYIKQGQPVGYWRTYYPNGVIKSEGNRVNGNLDGPWKFYNKNGRIIEVINYQKGLKNGYQFSFNQDSIVVRKIHFIANKEQDTSFFFYPDGDLKEWSIYENGKLMGRSVSFSEEGIPIQIKEFKNGKLLEKSSFNAYNAGGLKQGVWKRFNDDWDVIYEVEYLEGLKHGYERLYDEFGKLQEIRKYSNGKMIKEAEETQSLDVQTKFGEKGKIEVGGYNTKGQKEGVHQTYDTLGNPISSKIYDDDQLLSEGIISSSGRRNGFWKLYYSNGELKAQGNYKNDKKIGSWKYYYGDSTLQHVANYSSAGKPTDQWIWFFESGDTLAILNYSDGNLEGNYFQFDENGKKIVVGRYGDDMKQGTWKYIVGSKVTIGDYQDDNREGEWITRDTSTNKIVFKGKYQGDLATGFHKYSYDNGVPKKFGNYSSGEKIGTWKYFKPSGELLQTISYEQGLEVKFDDYLIDPRNTFKPEFDY